MAKKSKQATAWDKPATATPVENLRSLRLLGLQYGTPIGKPFKLTIGQRLDYRLFMLRVWPKRFFGERLPMFVAKHTPARWAYWQVVWASTRAAGQHKNPAELRTFDMLEHLDTWTPRPEPRSARR